MIVKQISSLEKIRCETDMRCDEIHKISLLKGERFSYQIAIQSPESFMGVVEIESELKEYIKVFRVENANMDKPLNQPEAINDDINYITKEKGPMPDILVPVEEQNNYITASTRLVTIWVEINVPEDFAEGVYSVCVRLAKMRVESFFGKAELDDEMYFEKNLEVEVLSEKILPQSLIYTRWFYADCIADYHGVEVYSERHWELIEKYIEQAADVGINMILVPVHTPPLDTAIGTRRTCVQLVDIEKVGDKYIFGFDKFRRFVGICKKCGIKYYEIAHMFSQWGAEWAPNIMVTENGKTDYMFGWHVAADSDEYVDFLKQYIAAITEALKEEGISEYTYFHISDEPKVDGLEKYKKAYDIIKPLIGNSKTIDALSEYEFYEKGLVECPVTIVRAVEDFLPHNVEHQWVYYCCGPQYTFTNSIMAMPSARVRILGVLMYKFNIEGFLHWGMNFYNGFVSRYRINPYVTTSGYGVYPSGDPFILYPAPNGAYNSIRGKVTFDAIGDMNLCRTLEKYIGKDEVIKLIDSCAGMDVTFSKYPTNQEYYSILREKLIETLKKYI